MGPTPRKKEATLEGRARDTRAPMELVQKQVWLSLAWVAWKLGACREPRTVIRGGVSAGLVGKHRVNMAQDLGVWFWGQSQSSIKKKKKKR
jgi:hypothetical protein